MGCSVSLVHFSDSYLDVLPENLGVVSHEHGERIRQDISTMEKRYQGTWIHCILVDYCWTVRRDVTQTKYNRMSSTMTFYVMYILFII